MFNRNDMMESARTIQIVELGNGEIARRSLSQDFLLVGSPEPCNFSSRKWKVLASDNILWSNLFKERWGEDRAAFYAPTGLKSWKDVYEAQDRCDRVGLGLKIIREGVGDYYLVHQGEIQHHLGSKRQRKGATNCSFSSETGFIGEGCSNGEEPCLGILDKILFFIGDLEVASTDAKRGRIL